MCVLAFISNSLLICSNIQTNPREEVGQRLDTKLIDCLKTKTSLKKSPITCCFVCLLNLFK